MTKIARRWIKKYLRKISQQ